MKTILSLAVFLATFATAQTPTVFNVPAAGIGSGQGTYPTAINHSGLVAGYYRDNLDLVHGFMYSAGLITTFDAYGAFSQTTSPSAMSDNGTIIGYFTFVPSRSNGSTLGFVRTPSGSFTTIQGSTNPNVLTYPVGLNNAGIVVGRWLDLNSTQPFHAFVRSSTGILTTFDIPEGVNGSYANAVNSSGTIVGFYQTDLTHGYLRDQFGNVTNFDVPGASDTLPWAINDSGTIAGYYTIRTTLGTEYHGFVRNADGTFTSFDVPGVGQMFYPQGSQQVVINKYGEVAGVSTRNNGAVFGWTRSVAGIVTQFKICGNTGVSAINDAGKVVGYCGGMTPNLYFSGFLSR